MEVMFAPLDAVWLTLWAFLALLVTVEVIRKHLKRRNRRMF